MGDLSPLEEGAVEQFGEFLARLEATPMNRSYKMLVLLAMLGEDALPGRISIERLTERFADLARRYPGARTELDRVLHAPDALRQLIESNPIAAWTGGRGMGGASYFAYEDGEFATTFAVPEELREPLQDLVRELVEWRLVAYLAGKQAGGRDRVVAQVSRPQDRPILFLPDRERVEDVPEGWQTVVIDGEELQANFGKVAVDEVTRPGSTQNILPEILRKWYGSDAGQPGRRQSVVFERAQHGYTMRPAAEAGEARADEEGESAEE
jgi:hypothetical protein